MFRSYYSVMLYLVQEEVVLTGPGVLDKTMLGVIWTIAFLYGCLSEQILIQVFSIYF